MGGSDSKCQFTDIHEILPPPAGLYLSSRPPRLAESSLHKRGIFGILDVTCAHTPIEHLATAVSPWSSKMKYLNLPVFDTEESDLKRYFLPANAFISECRNAGLGVLVHCERGVSRSVACVIAYLLSEKQLPLIDAYREVTRCRSVALPNTAFLCQLMAFEQDQTGHEPQDESLFSVVLLERDIVPGLKDLGVTHRQLTKAISQHHDNWPLAVRQAMNEAVGDSQAPPTLKLQKDGQYKVTPATAPEKARLRHAHRRLASKHSQEMPKDLLHVIVEDPDSPHSDENTWEPSGESFRSSISLSPYTRRSLELTSPHAEHKARSCAFSFASPTETSPQTEHETKA